MGHFIDLIGTQTQKLPYLVAPHSQIFQGSYLSCGESLNHNILSHYYLTDIKHIFENITYITKNTPKMVAKILATNFGFVPDWDLGLKKKAQQLTLMGELWVYIISIWGNTVLYCIVFVKYSFRYPPPVACGLFRQES